MENKNKEEKSEGEGISQNFTISLGGASEGKYINIIF